MTPIDEQPLRVAMASYYLPSDSKAGVGYQAHAIACALTARGHDVTIFTSSPPVLGAEYRTETVSLRGSMRTLKFALSLRRMNWKTYDVLHAHAGDYLIRRGRIAAHVRTVHGSSLSEAIHIRGARNRAAMMLYWVCEMLATAVADEAVAVSANTRRWRPWIRTVIPNGVDLTRFHPGERSRTPALLFVGTYEHRKRGRLLADIFEHEILPQLPEAELWMVAEDAPQRPQRPGVKVLGRVSEHELADLYRRAWVFCLPSTYEGFGIPYIEAMASGCPVVATPNRGAIEVLEGGRHGVIAHESELASVILRLLESAEERDRLSRAGLSQVGRYDLATVAETYEGLYRRLLDRKGRGLRVRRLDT